MQKLSRWILNGFVFDAYEIADSRCDDVREEPKENKQHVLFE